MSRNPSGHTFYSHDNTFSYQETRHRWSQRLRGHYKWKVSVKANTNHELFISYAFCLLQKNTVICWPLGCCISTLCVACQLFVHEVLHMPKYVGFRSWFVLTIHLQIFYRTGWGGHSETGSWLVLVLRASLLGLTLSACWWFCARWGCLQVPFCIVRWRISVGFICIAALAFTVNLFLCRCILYRFHIQCSHVQYSYTHIDKFGKRLSWE